MKYLAVVCFFLGVIGPALGQEIWSLEKCVAHALDHNLDIKQSSINAQIDEVNLKQAKDSRYPSLNGSAGVNWNFGRNIDPITNEFSTQSIFSNNFGVSSGVLLWNASRITNTIKQNEINLEASQNDLEQNRRNISLQVAVNYLNVLFAKENIEISERQLALNQQQYDQISKLINAGARPRSELLNLEAQIATSEQNLVSSTNSLELNLLNLKQVMLIPPDADMEVIEPDDVEITTDPDLISFAEAYELAKKNRLDITASELRMESADLGIKIAEAAKYPSLSMSGSFGTGYSSRGQIIDGFEPATTSQTVNVSSNDSRFPVTDVPITISSEGLAPIFKDQYLDQLNGNLSYRFGFGLNVPIYNNGSANANIERAKLNALRSSYAKDQMLETLKITVQQSIADARAAKKRLEASRKTVEAQRLALDNTTKRLDIGAANSFEWETQKTNLENAELTALIDKYNYIFAVKTLEFYLGKPMKI